MRAAAGTPTFDPVLAPCRLCEDMPCITACPTDALAPGNPAKMGTARINPLDCLASDGCTTCSQHCPVPWAIRARSGKAPVINPKDCVGCGVCAHVLSGSAQRGHPRTPDGALMGCGSGQDGAPQMPDLWQGVLQGEALATYLADLEQVQQLTATFSGGPGRMAAEPRAMAPDGAAALVRAGVRVQLRYRYEGGEWWDTLMPLRAADGPAVKLVRIKQER